MTNLNRYNHRVSILFNHYLQGVVELDEFIQKLRIVEALHRQNLNDNTSDNSMWFKFSDDDTLGTTIDDLERDLSNTNRDFTLERMKEAINLERELFIHYS